MHPLTKLIHDDMIPALGVTEPGAIAFAAARARSLTKVPIQSVAVAMNSGLYKNAFTCGIPNSHAVGNVFSAALGVVAGNWEKGLEALADVTEADNAAIIGLAQAAAHARRLGGAGSAQPHVVVSAIEHDAVLAPAKRLEQMGFSVARVQPDRNGFITAAALEQVMRPETVLVSVMAANSEVGSVQPVAELARTAHAAGALFHTDATQALGKVPVNVVDWGCDAASFSAHKVGGPKGAGALYVKNRTPFDACMLGGGQEAGRRSGTQNVCGAAGFAAAIQVAQEKQADEQARLGALRDKLYAALAEKPGVRPTVQVAPGSQDYLPNIVHVLVDALESETLILRFDMRGFGVSGGSACSSHSLEPSHVLRAIGIDADAAHGALRISMGRYTTAEDVQGFLDVIDSVLNWE